MTSYARLISRRRSDANCKGTGWLRAAFSGAAPSCGRDGACTRLLPRTWWRCAACAQFLPLFFRQFLVFTPALVQLIMLFRGELLHALVTFDRLRPLLGRQRDPLMHALLDALLSIRWQAGITRGQANPVFTPFRIEFVPLLLKRGQDGFLFGRQFRPSSTRRLRIRRARNRGHADEQGKRQYYCCDCA